MIFRGEKVRYEGKAITLPLPNSEGKAIKVAHDPTDLPIYLATLGPKSLEYTGEAANGWLGTSFSPDHPEAHLSFIESGAQKSGRALSDIDLCVSARVEIGDDLEAMIDKRRPAVAFNMGGMGSADTNFYNDAFKRAGYSEEARAIQALWLAGKREEAAKRVPDAMITEFQVLGPRDHVKSRIKRYKAAGVTTLKLGLDGAGPLGPARFELLEEIVDLVTE